MLSPELEKAFRKLLTEIRRRFKYLDFSMVDPDIGYLPSDLGMMLGYLYKRSVRQNLTGKIISDKLKTTATMTQTEVDNRVEEDLKLFASLFTMHDDGNYDAELRHRYCVSNFEKKFRKDQSVNRRADVAKMRAITTFFLKRIKDIATQN